MKKNYKILFIGRKDDIWSKKILVYLKKNFKHIEVFYSSKYFEKIPKKIKIWNGDYILSFRSLLILNKRVINQAKVAAINFHPGPPEYRGVGCLNYAIYNEEKNYGVTAHIMNKKIDNGKILSTQRFKLNKKLNLEDALKITHKKLYKLVIIYIDKILSGIITNTFILKYKSRHKWSNSIKTLKDLQDFYEINKNTSNANLLKKIKATNTKKFKPYIIIKGKKFIYDDKN